jgi:hypothetical protein
VLLLNFSLFVADVITLPQPVAPSTKRWVVVAVVTITRNNGRDLLKRSIIILNV